MPPPPLVGVVIANYNSGAFVGQTIESVARQTFRDVQAIVVDDASTDRSDHEIRQCLSRLDDPRFRYIRLESTLGQADAIKRGLEQLDTPFVSMLGTDSSWHETFVARQIVAHLNADHPAALVYCHTSSGAPPHDATGRITLHRGWTDDATPSNMASMMFRRSFVDLVFARTSRAPVPHLDFYLSTLARLFTGAIAVEETLCACRSHGNSTWNAVAPGATRSGVLKLIQRGLKDNAKALRHAFGDTRHAEAIALVRRAIGKQALSRKGENRIGFLEAIATKATGLRNIARSAATNEGTPTSLGEGDKDVRGRR